MSAVEPALGIEHFVVVANIHTLRAALNFIVELNIMLRGTGVLWCSNRKRTLLPIVSMMYGIIPYGMRSTYWYGIIINTNLKPQCPALWKDETPAAFVDGDHGI